MASLGVAANTPLYGLAVELVMAAGRVDEWESSKRVDGHHFHLRIENEGFMPLVVEAWNTGDGHTISMAHYWTCNGDAMRDPEVVMMGEGRILSFQQDPAIYHETSVREETTGGVAWKVNMRLYASVLSFTKMWARNIKAQGFIEAAKKVTV